MKNINSLALAATQQIKGCRKQTGIQQSTSDGLRSRKAFIKLWTLLQNHYQHQGFIGKIGLSDGETAALWFYEFQKNGIGFNEIVLIGNNLGELSRPEFIPNVFQLINLAKRLKRQQAEQHRNQTQQVFLSPREIELLREETKKTRTNELHKMREKLNKLRGELCV